MEPEEGEGQLVVLSVCRHQFLEGSILLDLEAHVMKPVLSHREVHVVRGVYSYTETLLGNNIVIARCVSSFYQPLSGMVMCYT